MLKKKTIGDKVGSLHSPKMHLIVVVSIIHLSSVYEYIHLTRRMQSICGRASATRQGRLRLRVARGRTRTDRHAITNVQTNRFGIEFTVRARCARPINSLLHVNLFRRPCLQTKIYVHTLFFLSLYLCVLHV